MRVVAPPFLRAPLDSVTTDAWQTVTGGIPGPLAAVLPHWDSNSGLSLLRNLSVDVARIRKQCALAAQDDLRAVVVWRSSGTALRGVGSFIDITSGVDKEEVLLKAEVPGHLLGGDVQLHTQIVLARPEGARKPLAARVPGSVLWDDRMVVSLEGSGSRFPMEVVDFSAVYWAPYRAGWYLSWNKDEMAVPFLRNVRLYLNSSHVGVVSAVQSAKATPEQRAIRSTIYYDVGRQLVRGALQNEEFVERPEEYGEGSTGHTLLRLLRAFFGAETPKGLRGTMLSRPEYFDSLLQGSFGLFATE